MKNCENNRGTGKMYLACGLILAAGAVALLFLMMAAHTVVHEHAGAAGRAAAVYLYFAGSALPCAAAVGMLAAIVRGIGQDRSFTETNARLMRGIAGMAFGECAYILAGLIGWTAVGVMNPGVMLLALALICAGTGVGILAWSLAGLISRACALQTENDLTV